MNLDWWILTFLPLLVLSIILIMSLLVSGGIVTLKLAIEQLLTFSLLLSTSDLAKRAMHITNDDHKTPRLVPLITIILSTGFLFTYVALQISDMTNWINYLFLFLAVATTIASLRLYYKNPVHKEPKTSDYVDERINQEKDLLNLEEEDNDRK